ncbi:MAG: heterodisulfide reductase subunit B [Ignavibacteria bacterium]|nr:MAG: heterodisulfide reductase subunit B [Ignavibacteria bacterium]KAF0160466.1 MAG: heterodisulfide reductase subunit B [Ignavibacteria bacterium]
MKIGYYPGCSLLGTGKEYDLSLRKILQKLDVELEELNDWSCCGATSAHATNHLMSIALPAINLSIAEKQKINELFAPCAACYNRMIVAKHELDNTPLLAKQVSDLIEKPINFAVDIINVVELFERIGVKKIEEARATNLKGIKAACYYGCLLVRPFNITHFDDAEQPTSMEKIIAATGAEAIDWNYKIECCGGAHSIAHKEIVVDLSKKILDDAKFHGADVVVVACPMCHSNLDMRQRSMKNHQEIPVLYLSEFIGLALGVSPKELGVDLHFVSAEPLIQKIS